MCMCFVHYSCEQEDVPDCDWTASIACSATVMIYCMMICYVIALLGTLIPDTHAADLTLGTLQDLIHVGCALPRKLASVANPGLTSDSVANPELTGKKRTLCLKH